MPSIEERKKFVHVRVNPPSRKYLRYRTVDVGQPGGMKAVIGVVSRRDKHGGIR